MDGSTDRDDVGALRAELDALKASLVDPSADRAPWRFSPTERRIFAMLLASDVVSKKTIALLIWPSNPAADLKSLDVYIARIRAKTSKSGLSIETIHGVGYRLADRRIWAERLAAGADVRQ